MWPRQKLVRQMLPSILTLLFTTEKGKMPFWIDHLDLKIIGIQHHLFSIHTFILLDGFEIFATSQVSFDVPLFLAGLEFNFGCIHYRSLQTDVYFRCTFSNHFATDDYFLFLGEILAQFLVDM